MAIPGSPLLGKWGSIPLSICLLCFGYIHHYNVGAVCCRIPRSSVHLGVFHEALLLFYLLILLGTESNSSCINRPSLMSKFLRIIFVIALSVTYVGFPSKFSKCCFHRYIRSSWVGAFSWAFAVLFILLTLLTVCYAILDCLSSSESLILLIWLCMYSICSFKYMIANSFCAFLRLRVLILVRLFLLHLEAVFTSSRFFLTANVSHGPLGLAFCLVGMH